MLEHLQPTIEKVLGKYAQASTFEPKTPPHVMQDGSKVILSVVGMDAPRNDVFAYGVWDTVSNELECIGKEVASIFKLPKDKISVGTDGISRHCLVFDLEE